MKKLIGYILFLLIIVTLSTCKKYPENTLWFKSPLKLSPFNGHLIKYNVNGIDSLDLLNVYFGNAIGLKRNIKEANFITQPEYVGGFKVTLNFGSSGLETGIVQQFTKKNKFVKIGIVVDTNIYKKNLFINSDIEWKIVRLAKKGLFKINTTLSNGNTYEIEIGT